MYRRKFPGRQTLRLPYRMEGNNGKNDVNITGGRWWEKREDDALSAAWSWYTTVSAYCNARNTRDALCVGLYDGEPPAWLGTVMPSSPLLAVHSKSVDHRTRARANLIRRCMDTAVAFVAKNVIEIRCVTDGGSWRLQKKARQRTKFINGTLREMLFHASQQRSFIDGGLTRSGGWVRPWIDWENERIRCDRVHWSNMVWNEGEGPRPRTLADCTPMSRDEVLSRYPDCKKEIMAVKMSEKPVTQAFRRTQANDTLADMIDVLTITHLGTGQEHPGRKMILLRNCVLEDDVEWTHDGFPYARFCWDDADAGFQCKPAVDMLIGYHLEIGQYMQKISRGHSLTVVPRVWIEYGSDVVEDEITNKLGGVGHYKGTPPIFNTASAFPPEFYSYLDWLFTNAMADIGFNNFQTQGQKPAGIEAGIAIREYNDTANTRQVPKGQRLERQTEQMGDLVMYLGSKIADNVPGFSVRALGTGSYEKVDFSSVTGDNADIRINSNPVSALPSSTPGKIQTITDMIKGGLLPPEEVQGGLALKLLNFPDLEKVVTMETANRELAEMQVDLALYEGKYLAPEPYQSQSGLKLLKLLACQQYFHAQQMDDVPDRNMDMLRRLMSESDALEKRITGSAQINTPAAAVPPPAPAPLEQSPLAPPPIPAAPAPMQPPGGMPQ
jgi:hypothetical protein